MSMAFHHQGATILMQYMFRVNPQGGGHSQRRGLGLRLYGQVQPHILRISLNHGVYTHHKSRGKIIMNLNIHRSQGNEHKKGRSDSPCPLECEDVPSI